MAKAIIPAIKGTRDFYPEKMAVRRWIESHLAKVSALYGYQEWEGPYLEKIDLYAAKSGEELVREQAFVFNDRGGDPITLRPELTPTLARMVAQRQNELVFPIRWWSFGPFWRYERPQRGRTREFFQWNVDLIGVNSTDADAELISLAVEFLRSCGFTPDQVNVMVNDRQLLGGALEQAGFAEDLRKVAFGLIDRWDKLSPEAWRETALNLGISPTQLEKLEGIIRDEALWKQSPSLVRTFEILKANGLTDYVRYNPLIVRGLDYYTGVVFEAKDCDGGRSVLGGGRYENLVADVGGNPLSACGFAMGDVMIEVLLDKYSLIPPLNPNPAEVLVTIFDAESSNQSWAIASNLRANGIDTVLYPDAVRLSRQMKYADRLAFKFVVVCGPDEASRQSVVVKSLQDGSQEEVRQSALADWIQSKLKSCL